MNPPSGLAKIVRFNWPWYVLAAVVLAGGVWMLRAGSPSAAKSIAIAVGIAVGAFWLVASLAVSSYVYDHSGVARGEWLRSIDAGSVRRAAILHAGQDEASELAFRALPHADIRTFDFFDASRNGTPSLARARAWSKSRADTIAPDRIPLADEHLDLALLVFAAHEVRREHERKALFRELARVLAPHGRLIVVEHLRDAWNCLAFGPGALHFLSRATWLRTFRAGGLRIVSETRCTRFVRVFELGAPA